MSEPTKLYLEAQALVAVELARYHAELAIGAVTIPQGEALLAHARRAGDAMVERVTTGLAWLKDEQ